MCIAIQIGCCVIPVQDGVLMRFLQGSTMLRFVQLIIATSLFAFDALADHPVSFPETQFYGMSNFHISLPDGSDTREVILNVYLSPMGSTFKSRSPTTSEMDEIREVCRYMVDLLKGTAAGEPDDYFIEFADGLAPLEQIPPSQRSVFGFTREEGCDSAPEMIGLE